MNERKAVEMHPVVLVEVEKEHLGNIFEALYTKGRIELCLFAARGSITRALAFYDEVRCAEHIDIATARIVGEVDVAGLIAALAADYCQIGPHASIHFRRNGSDELPGDQQESAGFNRAGATASKDPRNIYARILAERTGGCLSSEDICRFVREERRISAEEAKEYKLVDEVLP